MEAATTYNGITESEEDASRKGAKLAKFGANKNLFFFAPLESWREKIFEVVLLKISIVRLTL